MAFLSTSISNSIKPIPDSKNVIFVLSTLRVIPKGLFGISISYVLFLPEITVKLNF